jgi:hypothetical protein
MSGHCRLLPKWTAITGPLPNSRRSLDEIARTSPGRPSGTTLVTSRAQPGLCRSDGYHDAHGASEQMSIADAPHA